MVYTTKEVTNVQNGNALKFLSKRACNLNFVNYIEQVSILLKMRGIPWLSCGSVRIRHIIIRKVKYLRVLLIQ